MSSSMSSSTAANPSLAALRHAWQKIRANQTKRDRLECPEIKGFSAFT